MIAACILYQIFKTVLKCETHGCKRGAKYAVKRKGHEIRRLSRDDMKKIQKRNWRFAIGVELPEDIELWGSESMVCCIGRFIQKANLDWFRKKLQPQQGQIGDEAEKRRDRAYVQMENLVHGVGCCAWVAMSGGPSTPCNAVGCKYTATSVSNFCCKE